MRLVSGLLLAVLCISSGGATDRTAWLSELAGVPIRIFDLQAPNVSDELRTFMTEVPMTNNRPVPGMLIDDTIASLNFLKSSTPADEPTYFVASYINKTPLVALPSSSRQRYLERYGETVYPQQACPVFLDRAGASVPKLLSTAVNLPVRYFTGVFGSAENFDRLFGLTEASHCGFIARELVEPTVVPRALGRRELRMLLEALGDHEAIAIFRATERGRDLADEADVLFASRLLSMFLIERPNPYTPIPALLHEYQRIGVQAAHGQLERITGSVTLARKTFRTALAAVGAGVDPTRLSIAELQAGLLRAKGTGALALDDPLARVLITDLQASLRLLQGDRTALTVPEPPPAAAGFESSRQPLVTFIGASLLPTADL